MPSNPYDEKALSRFPVYRFVQVDPETFLPVTPGQSGNDISTAGLATEETLSNLAVALNPPLSVTPTAPVPITDNGGSITVDGTVAVSGVHDVSVANTPTVNINGTVPVSDGNGSLTVDGSVSVSSVGGTVTVGTHAVTQSGSWSVSTMPNNTTTAPSVTIYRNVTLSNVPQQIKSGATRWWNYSVYNAGAAMSYFQVYNALAANVTVGTTAPLITIGIPPGSVWDGFWSLSPNLSAGFTVAATMNADGSGGAPATALGVGFLGYV